MKASRAVAEYEKALNKDPGNLPIRVRLAAALRDAGRLSEAEAMYLTAARAYHHRSRDAQAIALCRTVLAFHPASSEARSLLERLDTTSRPAHPGPAGAAGPPVHVSPFQELAEALPTAHGVSVTIGARQSTGQARPTGAPALSFHAIPEIVKRRDSEALPAVSAKVSFRRPRKRVTLSPQQGLRSPVAQPPPVPPPIPAEGGQPGRVSPRLAQVLGEASAGMNLKRYPGGHMIVREGDAGDSLFLIVRGQARVLKSAPGQRDADLVDIASLGEGEIFGELAVMADHRRHATVQAVGEVTAYEIPRHLLTQLTRAYPDLGAQLESYYRERLLGSLLSTSSFMRPLSPERRQEVLKKLILCRFDADEMVIHEGAAPDGFYLVVLGSVHLLQDNGRGAAVLVASLTEGSHFGAAALMRGEGAPTGIMAASRVELARLPVRDFYDVVANEPALWSLLRSDVAERMALLAG